LEIGKGQLRGLDEIGVGGGVVDDLDLNLNGVIKIKNIYRLSFPGRS
jgi:hypothetical protein